MRLSGRLFRLIVLVSVVINLGDAPYLDEILADESPQPVAQTSLSSGAEQSFPQAPDPAKNACSGYQLLLHLCGVIPKAVTVLAVSTPSKVLPHEFRFLAFAPADRIEHPPRSNSPAL